MADDRWLRVTPSCRVALDDLDWRMSRSGGPGGQHANTSDTRVEVRLDVTSARSLGPRQKARLHARYGPVVRAVAARLPLPGPEPRAGAGAAARPAGRRTAHGAAPQAHPARAAERVRRGSTTSADGARSSAGGHARRRGRLTMGPVGDTLVVIAGVALIVAVGDSALRTFVLPRGVSSLLTRAVFQSLRSVFNLMARMTKSYEGHDRVMALYAPLGLFLLVGVWVVLVLGGYTLIYYGLVDVRGWRQAFELSGSSFFTLGFVVPPDDLPSFLLVFSEAGVGLAVLALLIAYLPTIYNAFSRRELAVAQLGDAGRHAAERGRAPGAVPRDRMERSASRAVVALGDLVRRAGGDPHVARRPGLLPVAQPTPVVGHGVGRGPRRGGHRPVDARGPVVPAGGPLHPVGVSRAPRGRRLLPDPVRPGSGSPGSHQHRPVGVRRGVRAARGRGCPGPTGSRACVA